MRNSVKYFILILGLAYGLFLGADKVSAQYGQEVLGVETEETVIVHETIDTGIEDHFDLLGFGFVAGSLVFYTLSRKAKSFN